MSTESYIIVFDERRVRAECVGLVVLKTFKVTEADNLAIAIEFDTRQEAESLADELVFLMCMLYSPTKEQYMNPRFFRHAINDIAERILAGEEFSF